ncbi:hypothetical protein ACQEUX_16740 [Micromonospora sp. CA-259024]|uniref:hypothetical protein n=1 Tax=Micromonospora sp. CA-259024 TaxID=3239965 RepID=UPI003D92009C
MTETDELLTAAQRGLLRLQAVVITDWRDGPIEGIARLSAGDGLWKFKIFADSASSEDVSERLYLLSALPKESAEPRILELIAGVRLPLVWPFDNQPNAAAAKSAVDLALDAARQAALVVSSNDFDVVVKAWLVEVEFRSVA